MQLKLTLTFLILLTSCGRSVDTIDSSKLETIASNIYGGQRVVDGQWKSVISFSKISYDGKVEGNFCTGTLIDERTVLSAAHCFKRAKEYYLASSVVTRDNEDTTEKSFTKIKNIRIHPGYEGEDSPFDFALVDLVESAGVDKSEITPVSTSSKISLGDSVDLVGFGKIEDGSHGVKFEVKTTVRQNFKTEFIAGGEGRDTCAGDSGGPLFKKNASGEYELFGVTSRTPDDATSYCGDKTIYGKVSTAMKWVSAEREIDRAVELDSLESIDLLNKAKAKFPKYSKIHLLLGKFYLKFNMIKEATSTLVMATTLDPKDKEVLNLLRESYFRIDDTRSEITILERLLVLSPQEESYFKRLVSLNKKDSAEISRGIGHFLSNNYSFAVQDLSPHKAIPKAGYILAFTEFKQENFDKSLEILQDISSESISIIDLRDSRGDTFLMAAAFEDRRDIIDELIRFKPNLTLRDTYGNNLAEIAWWARAFPLVKFLVSIGVEWNVDAYIDQFLTFVTNEYIEEVRFMLDMGIDLTLVGPNGESAITLAKETKNQELIKLVESYGKEKSIK